MDVLVWIELVTIPILLITAALLLFNPTRIKLYLAACIGAIAFWRLSMLAGATQANPLLLYQISVVLLNVSVVAWVLFTVELVAINQRIRQMIVLVFSSIALLFSVGSLAGLTITNAKYNLQHYEQLTSGGILYPFQDIFLGIGLLFGVSIVAQGVYRGKHAKQVTRNNLIAIAVTVLTATLLSLASSWLFYDSPISDVLAPIAITTISLVFAYIIIVRRQFDIKEAAVITLVYVLSLVTLSGLYFLLAYALSTLLFEGNITQGISVSPLNTALALFLAFVFQPIKRFFDKITNSIFFRDRYNTDEFVARLGETLTTTTDLKSLLRHAAYEIGDTLKAERAFFYVRYGGSKHVVAGTDKHATIPADDIRWLDAALKNDKVQVTAILPPDSRLHRILISHKIAALLPLMHSGKTIGYFALGDQRVSGYTNRDIKVLSAISDELVIAIQNSLSVQEVKDINASLEQRIEAATAELRTSNARLKRIDASKDEFISMASHQLRTPLTSIKGYLSMVLEGDTGKITADQRHLLQEAFTSSERMVHLIHDFLNVSRLQNGKFMLEQHPYDLVSLIQSETNSLQRSAESRGLKLAYKTSLKELTLMIDETKVRQVVMNFIDNALYYSRPNGTITVKLDKVGDNVELRVVDNGIGVPKAEQEHLFTKFFRAANARKQRPDGTGVGIFLAKKVISEHGGEIIFESTEGVGSTFGFRLPISKLEKLEAN